LAKTKRLAACRSGGCICQTHWTGEKCDVLAVDLGSAGNGENGEGGGSGSKDVLLDSFENEVVSLCLMMPPFCPERVLAKHRVRCHCS